MVPVVRTAPRFSVAEAVRLADEFYGLRAQSAVELPSERDQNFRLTEAGGHEFVLKIANSEEKPEFLDLQNRMLEFLAGAGTGLQFPRLIPARSGESNAQVRLLTWVDGVCLAEVQPHGPDLLASLGRALAAMDASLEGFSHPAAHRTFHWDLRHASMAWPHVGMLPEARRALVRGILESWERVDWDTLRFSIIHNDANDYNVIVDEAGTRVVSVLDFGDVVFSATVCNLAIALAYVMLGKRDPIQAAAQVVSAYHTARPLTEPEIDVLYTLAATRLAMSVCYAAYQAREAPHNEYLNISNGPAWALLEQLAQLPHDWPRDVFRRACGLTRQRDLVGARKSHLGPSLSLSYNQPLHIVRGWRQHLYDASGRAYLDCVNNVAHVGHCHPRVVRAGAEQMALLNTNTRYLHEHLAEYIERLAATLPEPLSVVYLVCSGSEANELALRLARAHTGRDEFIVVDTGYHGNTNALIDISPYKFNGPGGRGKPANVHVLPYSADADVAACGTRPAAFICESILSCAGQVVLPPGYLRRAYEVTRGLGGVCIADEVQTGFGRVGSHFWAFETQGVVPDIVTMGKPIGNGHPMGAVVTTREIADSFANGMEYFNTFGGNPVSCAVGMAVLDVIADEQLQENALQTGRYLIEGLKALMQDCSLIGDVRGLGLFLGFELVRNRKSKEPAPEEASRLVNQMKDRGILLSTDGPFHNVIKIKPPLIFSRADADFLLRELRDLYAPCETATRP
ncbi:MAG TPA: aminotransferase class III-fold pyridoxal phosphate-dependent enzyme [Bryobacteraceae bacterium]|nr:aminotransferase class III-fold pyridoxal phosphate-dependent enzyme [Bryobacteraceae bacterium]